jgi:ABC-2 type transport system ATP-binding protein
MTDLAIRTENLTRDFASVRAVDNLTFEVPKGIVFGFLGPNGSGKTTTIRLLLGLLEPTQGRAQVLGYDTQTQSSEIRQRTGALLEHHGLYERLTAYENLEFFGRIACLSRRERNQRIEELLNHLGLWDRRHESVGKWSRGMKQKLAVARALLHRPPLIFLDEPTAGLDPVAAAALRDDLSELAAESGVTVFLTTHNLAEAEKLCSMVGVIRGGALLAVGHPNELQTSSSGQRITVHGTGFPPGLLEQVLSLPEVTQAKLRNHHLEVQLKPHNGAAGLVRFLVHAGVQVEEVHKDKATLEDVFLTLVNEGATNGRRPSGERAATASLRPEISKAAGL